MKKVPSVLLIDDDETTNYINRLTITRAGIASELLVCMNGKEAIDLLQARCELSKTSGEHCVPNLILLDINMPIMDGFGFLDTLNNMEAMQHHNVVIAVLTTSANPRDIEKVKAAGVTELLSKPLTRDALLKLVAKYFTEIPASVDSN
ncbi:response regulator [Pontibacter burrus]|uniref:Response regulator n=1 Tax=Pontibacter burrus TaxID=2704466 RepID=A0A6B3LQD1_9BACT|nr:response regulator [Pontibacter burrus]NEM99092.1 response regulator [Pontibacter burrus]